MPTDFHENGTTNGGLPGFLALAIAEAYAEKIRTDEQRARNRPAMLATKSIIQCRVETLIEGLRQLGRLKTPGTEWKISDSSMLFISVHHPIQAGANIIVATSNDDETRCYRIFPYFDWCSREQMLERIARQLTLAGLIAPPRNAV